MKIGFVFDDSLDKTDGVQQYVLALGTWLGSQGHTVHYLVGQTVRKDLTGLYSLSRNINVRFNGNKLSMPLPASRSAIRKIVTSEQYDILHVQLPYSPFMAHRVIKQASPLTAVVGTFHVAPVSSTMTIGTKLLGLVLRSSLKRFDSVLSVSTAAHNFALQTFKLESRILPNVLDYNRFHRAKPLEQYMDDQQTILFLGRLVPRKGCQTLLEAISLLMPFMNSLPKLRVLICGTGLLEASLKQYVNEHGLSDYVTFTGYVAEKDKARYYASSDISVFPSSGGESFGIVLLEAMASGKAAILAGNNSGYAAVLAVKPELLFDAVNAQELADKLRHMLINVAYRKEIANWGADYTRQFDTAKVGRELLNVYKQALRLRRDVR